MTQGFDSSFQSGEEPKRRNTGLIIAIVVLFLLCLCCALAGAIWALWTYGDQIFGLALQGLALST